MNGFVDQLQLQRWELKYRLTPGAALAVRDFVRGYLELDKYASGPDFSYRIFNIYLDSPDLSLYGDTVAGAVNRFKLRARYYRESPDGPVFLEVKRRASDAILKQRAGIRREALQEVLAGRTVGPQDLLWPTPRSVSALNRFVELAARRQAGPVAAMRYDREAWVSPNDNSVRVTFDRNVVIAPWGEADPAAGPIMGPSVFGSQVIFELKFTARYPVWFGELVQVFGLRRDSASKYADGIERLGIEKFLPPAGWRRHGRLQAPAVRAECEAPSLQAV